VAVKLPDNLIKSATALHPKRSCEVEKNTSGPEGFIRLAHIRSQRAPEMTTEND